MKIYFFRRTVFNCKEATLLSLKKEEGAISLTGRLQLRYHLLYCSSCQRFEKQSSFINKLGKSVIDSIFTHPPHKLTMKVKQEIQEQIDRADA